MVSFEEWAADLIAANGPRWRLLPERPQHGEKVLVFRSPGDNTIMQVTYRTDAYYGGFRYGNAPLGHVVAWMPVSELLALLPNPPVST